MLSFQPDHNLQPNEKQRGNAHKTKGDRPQICYG